MFFLLMIIALVGQNQEGMQIILNTFSDECKAFGLIKTELLQQPVPYLQNKDSYTNT